MTVKENNKWYNDNLDRYEQLKTRVDEKMNMLQYKWKRKNNIDIHSYSSRVKERESFLTKMKKGNDVNPENLKDLLGCRIICFSMIDVDAIVELLKSEFTTLFIKNKSQELGELGLGYQSFHLEASLKPEDMEPKYENMMFEIQVRTVFQDAWAVISHKTDYKHYGYMPEKIRRDLFLFSGTLELLDNTLNDSAIKMNDILEKIPEQLKLVEEGYQDVSDYIYTCKLFLDLKLDELDDSPSIEDVQKELFNTTTDIRESYKKNPELYKLSVSILDNDFEIYDKARRKIKFSSRAEGYVQKYMEKSIKISFEKDGNPIIIPKLTYIGTIWDKSMVPEYKDPSEPIVIDTALMKNLTFRNISSKFVTMGMNRVWVINNGNGESKNLKFEDNEIYLDNIPVGEYKFKVKVDYEPSDDSYAKFETLILLK